FSLIRSSFAAQPLSASTITNKANPLFIPGRFVCKFTIKGAGKMKWDMMRPTHYGTEPEQTLWRTNVDPMQIQCRSNDIPCAFMFFIMRHLMTEKLQWNPATYY